MSPRYLQPKSIEYTSPYDPNVAGLYSQILQDRTGRFDTAYTGLQGNIAELGELSSFDQEGKQQTLSNFTSRTQDIVDKYGGDYGAAARELTSLIAAERSNPFYAFNERQLGQSKQLEQAMAKNPNLYVLNDPRQQRFADFSGDIEDIKYDVADPEEIRRILSDEYSGLASRELPLDPITRTAESGLQYDIARSMQGLSPVEIQQLTNSGEMTQTVLANMPQYAQYADDPQFLQFVGQTANTYAQQLRGGIKERTLGRVPTTDAEELKNAAKAVKFGSYTPVVPLERDKLFNTKNLEKKTDRTISSVQGPRGTITSFPKSGESYRDLEEKEMNIFSNVAKSLYGVDKKNSLNDYDDVHVEGVKEFLNNVLSPEEISVFSQPIDNNLEFPQTVTGASTKGALGMTNYIFGGTTIKEGKAAGQYINRRFLDPETGEVLSGTQFKEDVLEKFKDDEPLTVLNTFSSDNPYALIAGDDNFAKSYQVVVGNKQYIMSADAQEVVGGVDQVPVYETENKIARLKYGIPNNRIQQNIPLNSEYEIPANTWYDGQYYYLESKVGSNTLSVKTDDPTKVLPALWSQIKQMQQLK